MNDNGNEPDTLLADLGLSVALKLRPGETVREALDRMRADHAAAAQGFERMAESWREAVS